MNWLKKIIARVLGKRTVRQTKTWPSREAIRELPLFDALTLEDVVVVDSPAMAAQAQTALSHQRVLGFDTESRPTFAKGEASTGPHVAQFSTSTKTYVFMLHEPESCRVACALMRSAKIKKVGFGLDSDRRLIPKRLHIKPQALIDLAEIFARNGYGRGVGVKVAVAIVFQRRFLKSKSASTSNWGRATLAPHQLLYAANDAYAALRVYEALEKQDGGK